MTRINKYGEIEDTTCSGCGNPIKMEWVACPHCGKALSNNCPQCQKPLKSEWKACPHCGQPLEQTPKQDTNTEEYEELKKWCKNALVLSKVTGIGLESEFGSNIPNQYALHKPENEKVWKRAAEAGIPEGHFLYGLFLKNVNRVEDAIRHLKTVSDSFSPAKCWLGHYLIDIGDSNEGLKLLKESADLGDATACVLLARRYENGDGIMKSKRDYRYYIERAAELGDSFAEITVKTKNLLGW